MRFGVFASAGFSLPFERALIDRKHIVERFDFSRAQEAEFDVYDLIIVHGGSAEDLEGLCARFGALRPYIVVTTTHIDSVAADEFLAAGANDLLLLDAEGKLVVSWFLRIEERLTHSEQRAVFEQTDRDYRELFEGAHDAIIIIRPHDEVVLEANQRACEIYRIPYEKLVGLSLVEISVNPQRGQRKVHQTLEKGANYAFQTTQYRGDGSLMYLDVKASVVEYKGEQVIVSINRDITEMKLAQQRLREQEDEIASMQRMEAIGQLAASVAHDFNNLLTIVHTCGVILEDETDAQFECRQEVDHIIDAARRGATLVRELMDFSRQRPAAEGALFLNSAIVRLSPLLKRLAGTQITVDFDLDDTIDQVSLTEPQLERILVNLVVNARDATSDHGRIVIATQPVRIDAGDPVKPPGVSEGRYVLLTVSDTGVGMDEDTVQRVFEPLFSTKGEGGTGLGLSTVYRIVTQSGGHPTVSSSLGQGTKFSLYLAVLDSTPAPSLTPPALSGSTQASLPPARVLNSSAFREMFDHIDDALYVIAVEGCRIIETNQAASRMLGFTREALLKMGLEDLKPDHLRVSASQWRDWISLLRSGNGLSIGTAHRHQEGHAIPVDIRLSLYEMDDTEYVIVVCRDQSFQSTNGGTFDIRSAPLERLVCWLAHRINNPMTTALRNVDWVLDRFDAEREATVALREARAGLLQMNHAVRQLMTGVAHLEAGQDAANADPLSNPVSEDHPTSVLIVDDDVLVTNVLKRMLSGHDVQVTHGAREALTLLKQRSFDIILCDLMMPGMTGVELYEKLQVDDPAKSDRMIFITGGVFTDTTSDFVNTHRARCLTKPFRLQEVNDLITRVWSSEKARTS